MPKRIGYIERDGIKHISVTDVFEYLREQGVIETEKQEYQYRWNFEQMMLKLLYDSYKSGEVMSTEVPFILDRVFYCHWLRFKYTDLLKAIKAVRNESELKKVAYAIDLNEYISKNKMFVKRTYAIK